MPQSVGIVGGRPSSSLYFVGFQRRRPAAAAAAATPGPHAAGGEAPREAAAVAAVGVPAGGATAAQAGAAAAPGWQEGSAAASAAAAASTVFYLDPHQVQEVSCCCFCKLLSLPACRGCQPRAHTDMGGCRVGPSDAVSPPPDRSQHPLNPHPHTHMPFPRPPPAAVPPTPTPTHAPLHTTPHPWRSRRLPAAPTTGAASVRRRPAPCPSPPSTPPSPSASTQLPWVGALAGPRRARLRAVQNTHMHLCCDTAAAAVVGSLRVSPAFCLPGALPASQLALPPPPPPAPQTSTETCAGGWQRWRRGRAARRCCA
jgi:hypothetical protein